MPLLTARHGEASNRLARRRSILLPQVALLVAALVLLGASGTHASDDLLLFKESFEQGLDASWSEQGFPSIARKNVFSLAVDESGNHYLKVESLRSSSGKGIHLKFSPSRCSQLSWRWIIAHTIREADITRKDGDDAAAKLYVVFDGPSHWNPLDRRILVYIWDNRAPVGAVLPNAWLPEKERMIVLESGEEKAASWVSEGVRLDEDFARAFPGESPGEVQALAFFADTDNTATQVWAGMDDLVIRCTASSPPQTER